MKRLCSLVLIFSFVCTASAQERVFELMDRTDLKLQDVESIANRYFDSAGTARGSGYKQFQRWLYERKFHTDENGYYITPQTEWNNYLQSRESMRTGNATAANWTSLGPSSWTYTSGWNPGTGRISAMAVHPANPNIIYAGSPGGGLWKSTNAGANWTPLTDNNSLWMSIYAITIDPLDQNIIYVGTSNGILLKSINGGSTFTTTGAGPSGTIRKILIHPVSTNIVFACSSSGIHRSTNGGTTWTLVHSVSKEDIEFKPDDVNIMYASGNDVVRSTDNGVSWTTLGVSQGITNSGRTLVAVSAADPTIVYAVQASGSLFGRMYRSSDAGLTFTTTVVGNPASGTNYFGYDPNGTGTTGQATYDMGMDISPTNANDVYIAGIICWRSINGGTSFTALTVWSYPNGTGYNHADVHGLFWIGGILYSISDGGMYKSLDSGDNWTDLSPGLTIRQFYRMANSPTNANVITGGAQDNGSVTRQSSGNWKDWLGADGMEGLVSPTDHLKLWGTSQNGSIYRSTNGGNSYTGLTQPSTGQWVTPLAIHPTNETILYGGWTGVYKSVNSGTNWTNISGTTITTTLADLAVAPSDPNYIYASNGATLYVTTNDGATWATRTAPATINDIAVDPTNPSKIWIACNSSASRIMVSTDAGASFTNVSANLPAIVARAVVVDDNTPRGIYVGMNIGVYYKAESDASWTDYTANLPLVAVNELELQKSSGKIRVATYGRSIWESPVAAPIGPVNDNCASATLLTSALSCNYLANQTVINATSSGKPQGTCDNFALVPDLADVWYYFQAQSTSHTITVDPNGSLLDPVIIVYNSCVSNTEVGCSDTPGGNGILSTLNLTGLTIGNFYYIRVYDYGLQTTSGDFRICVTHACTSPGAVTVSGGGTFCNSATLTATGGSGGTIYWQGNTSNGISTIFTATSQTVNASGTYYFRANNACGWGTEGSAIVTINNIPGAVNVSGGGTFCNSATITATGGTGGTIYWQGTTSNGTSTATPSTNQTVNASGTYYFRSNNGCGWGAEGSVTVTINNNPGTVSVSGGGTFCNSTTLTATGGTGGTIYWQGTTSGGTSTATASANQTVNTSGTYYFRANNGCGWGTEGSVTVTINNNPGTVSVSGGGTFCNSATLTATGGTGGTIYWQGTTSGGTSTATASANQTVNTSGTYYFRANNGCGWGAEGSVTVTINNSPGAVSVSGGGTFCNSATLTATGGTGGTIYWQGTTSGGTSTATASVNQTVNTSGTYYFRANNGCGWGAEGSVTVTINNSPGAVSVSGGGTFCNSATLTATGGTGGTIYWQGTTSGGTSTATASANQTVNASGTYYFRANNGCGWGNEGSVTVIINNGPGDVTVTGAGTFCNSATLTATGGTGGNIYWQGTTSNGTSITTASTNQTVNASGTYYFRANNGCGWGNEGSVTVIINNNPGDVTVSGGGIFCNSATLTATGGNGGTIYWQGTTGNGTSTATASANQTVNASGTYYFRANNGCGWGNEGNVIVDIVTPPVTPADPVSNSPQCGSVTITRTGTPAPGETWFWQGTSCGTSTNLGSGSTFNATTSGTYYIRAYNNAGNCWSPACGTVVVAVTGAPGTQANFTTLIFNGAGNSVTINLTPGNGSRRVVKMNTVNNFTNPANGTDPAANNVYAGSGEQVVYNGNGNTLIVSGITMNTTYCFRVYEANCTGTSSFYNVTAASNNPTCQAGTGLPAPDLTNSQFFTTTQIGVGGIIDEVIVVRNVGTAATSGPIVFTVTNYAPITGLSAASNTDPTVTIGFTNYTLDNANWTITSTASALTFTSNAGVVINPGATRFLGVKISRALGANGSVTHSSTIANGTGGGDVQFINNSISNTLLKNQ